MEIFAASTNVVLMKIGSPGENFTNKDQMCSLKFIQIPL